MDHGKWDVKLIDSTQDNETSEATLYLLHFGSFVPVLQVTSLGNLSIRTNGVWQGVTTEVALTNIIIKD